MARFIGARRTETGDAPDPHPTAQNTLQGILFREVGMAKVTVIRPQRQLPRPPGGVLHRSFRMGRRTVTITHDVDAIGPGVSGQAVIQWSPDVPTRLSAAEIRLYRKRRNLILQEIADMLGGNVVIADV
jgi:hypothetical protein